MTTRMLLAAAALAASLGFVPTDAATPAPTAPAKPAPAAPASPDMGRLADQALVEVRDRMHLTDEQIVRLKPLVADHFTRLRQLFANYTNDGGIALPTLMQEIRDRRASFQMDLAPILTPAQMQEFQVIRQEVDKELHDTICDQRLAILKSRLRLTADQETRLRPILSEDYEKKRAVVSMLTGSKGAPAAGPIANTEVAKIQADTEARLREVLTPDQMKAYDAYRDELRQEAMQGAG